MFAPPICRRSRRNVSMTELILSGEHGSERSEPLGHSERSEPLGHSERSEPLGHSERQRAEQSSSVRVQRLAGQREMCFTESLALGWVCMNQLGDVCGECIPIGDELRFSGQFTNSGTDHVDAHYRTVRTAYQLYESPSLEDLRLAVASEVVGQRFDITKARSRL